jgi:DNA (cytosine-5)-methyltransferase 1
MRSIELFAGAGGLALGVGVAGFTPVEVIERDRWCCDTIRANRARGVAAVSGWPDPFQGDVRDVDFRAHEGRIDLIAGGPPCQPFSLGGKHRAQLDARDMWSEAARALREIKPRAFLFENVKGLTRARFASYLSYIVLQLTHPELVMRGGEGWEAHLCRLERHHLGGKVGGVAYRVVYRVVNAADYGAPQRRERVVLVGFRGDLDIEWSFPAETHSAAALAREKASGAYWDRHGIAAAYRGADPFSRPFGRTRREAPDGGYIYDAAASRVEPSPRPLSPKGGRGASAPWRTVRDALADLPDPERDPALAATVFDHGFQPGARPYPGHTGSPLDEPAKTLKAGVHGVPGGENMLRRADGSVRYFTVRESARLQTFPDDYRLQGAWSETMRQLGNAVPVTLAAAVARDVAGALCAIDRRCRPQGGEKHLVP